MKKRDNRLAILALTGGALLSGCQSQPVHDVADERGMGGSGRQLTQQPSEPGHSGDEGERGIGGSGIQLADERGIGGSGRAPDERGIGGSGIQLADERGIGGSGRTSEERGMGGSGIQITERGIGGSGRRQQPEQTTRWLQQLAEGEKIGVVGTINDFGSIWVNGLHIQYDQTTPVTSDGEPISANKMQPGQRARVTATRVDGELQAESIELIHEVIGPASQLDSQNRRFNVLGQTILLPEALELPADGSWVSISGQRNAERAIVASHIESSTSGSVLVRGKAESSNQRLNINGLELPAGTALPNNGSTGFVVLKAQWSHNQLSNLSLERPQRFADQPEVRLLSIERHSSTLNMPGPWSQVVSQKPLQGPQLQVIEAQLPPAQPPVVDQLQPKPPVNWQATPPPAPQHMAQPQQGPQHPPKPAAQTAPPPVMDKPQPHQAQHARPPKPEIQARPAVARPEAPPTRPQIIRPERPQLERPERPQIDKPAPRPERPTRPPRPDGPDRPRPPRH